MVYIQGSKTYWRLGFFATTTARRDGVRSKRSFNTIRTTKIETIGDLGVGYRGSGMCEKFQVSRRESMALDFINRIVKDWLQ